MNLFLPWIVSVYARVLNLYPRRFKDEYAVEMHAVFRDSVMEAAEVGTLSLLLVCGREFMGMPFNILKELWHEIQGNESNMQSTQFSSRQPGSWGDSIWAGLPHLLIAILFATTGALVNINLATIAGVILALLLLAGFLATIYYTWRNHWPAWSASWYGYFGLIILLFSTVPYQYWEGLAEQIFTGLRFILLFLTLSVLLYWLTRRNPVEGLLLGMPVIILYLLPVMEFVPNLIRFWLTFLLFLLSALSAIIITRLNDIRSAVWLMLTTTVLTGLPIAYARTYWHNIPAEHASLPTIGQMIELFSVPWLASGALVLGPLLGWGLWNLGRNYGKVGRVSAVFVIAGMIVNFVGHLSYWWWFSKETYLNALPISALYRPSEGSSVFMVYAGLAAILVGAIGMAVLTWKKNKLLSIALILVPWALPLAARFSTYFGFYISLAGLSLELARLSEVYKSLIFFIGAAWLATTGWTITCLYNQPLHEGTA